MVRNDIEKAISKALAELGAGESNFVIERPALEHGDYATNAALAAAKALKKNPRDVAIELVEKIKGKIEGVEKIEVAGAGFINFSLSREALLPKEQKIPQIHTGKKIMVEYTDPNPFKEFHIGHLMSNAIGESIARLFEATGAQITRANYQGDVGPHVAKAIWGKMQKPELTWGAAYSYGDSQYESHKEEIDLINQKVYDKSDASINELYDRGRKESLELFEGIYKKLDTKFDKYFFESDTAPKGLGLVKAHPEVFEESEGATVFHGEHTRVFITSRGLPTYEAKDLGLLQLKKETERVDESITVTANEQSDYFKVVLAAAKKIPEVADMAEKTKHISHGMMRFKESKMSSRKGNVITGESLIKELTEAARNREDVAVGAIKYVVLRQNANKDIIFDPEKSLSLEGDSGPYVQYAHTRALSLVRAAKEAGIEGGVADAPSDPTVLERVLIHFPSVVEHAAQELEPHYVTTYITELAAAFNSWYANERVIGGPHPQHGTLLANAVEQTLAKGLNLLGIPAPEKM